MPTESDIMHENGRFWVLRDRPTKSYLVLRQNGTHSVSDSAFSLTSDGLSLAKARCDYLAKHSTAKGA